MFEAGVLGRQYESQSVEDALLEAVFLGRCCENVLLEHAVVGVTRMKMLDGRQWCYGAVVRASRLMMFLWRHLL